MDMKGNTDSAKSSGDDNDEEVSFQKPLTLTFAMFTSMLIGLFMHWIILVFHFPFPGYEFNKDDVKFGAKVGNTDQESKREGLLKYLVESSSNFDDNDAAVPSMSVKEKNRVPTGMYFTMAVLDVASTALW